MSIEEEKVEVAHGCWFEYLEHMGVSLMYIEHATDHWSSDSETEVDIDKAKAEEIINFLQRRFNIPCAPLKSE